MQCLGEHSRSAIGLTPLAPASTILGVAFYLLNAAEGVSSNYDVVETLLRDVGDVMGRMEVHSQENIDPRLLEILLRMVCNIL